MANPLFIPIQFAKNGVKNVIQKFLAPTQDPNDAYWDGGWGNITRIPKEDGGLPPKGQDFSGILYTLSDHCVHRQNGDQIVFDSEVITHYGGYAQNSIIQSDDGLKHFRSLINNNTFNPNVDSIVGRWEIYTGVGSVPNASSTVSGVMKVLNLLTSTDVGSALSAAMGKQLQDTKLNISSAFGVGQTYQNVTGSRSLGTLYINSTTKPIEVTVVNRYIAVADFVNVYVGGSLIKRVDKGANGEHADTVFTVPSGSSYMVTMDTNPNIQSWWELR